MKGRNGEGGELGERNGVGVYEGDMEIGGDWDGGEILVGLEGGKWGV